MEQTYYEILEIEPTAEPSEIRKRFRELARRYHPDTQGGAHGTYTQRDSGPNPHRFVRILEAYQVLRDPQRRAAYDRALSDRAIGKAASCRSEGSQNEGASSPANGRGDTNPRVAGFVLIPGARVEVDSGALVLVCRLHAVQGRTLYLAAPAGARCGLPPGIGAEVRLLIVQRDRCLKARATTCEWVWRRPPLLAVHLRDDWQDLSHRRTARRARRLLDVHLVLPDNQVCVGRTQDVSATGVSFLVRGMAPPRPGDLGRLTLQTPEDLWCEDLPIRVARVRNWLGSTGRAAEVGVQLLPLEETERLAWRQCLVRLGVKL